jgi:HlyD family secretion protein
MRLLLVLVVLAAIVAGAVAGYGPAREYIEAANRPTFRTQTAERGDVTEVINATGTIEPVESVHVGAFVSGTIVTLAADFNDDVAAGDLLAEIDPRLYESNVARDEAALAARKAELQRAEALLEHARKDEERAKTTKARSPTSIPDAEIDEVTFSRMAKEAEIEVAEAAVRQAEANLGNSKANLDYTRIVAPVSGIVIDRKIDRGQTVAAQFQTPELFVIAPDMRERVRIFAAVDEADIGRIRASRESGRAVRFTVDAYPGEIFTGEIEQVRLNSDTLQNVVTYPVVLTAANPELKLLPGMTADISFEIDTREGVLRVPNAALRFFPKREHVREPDLPILDGEEVLADLRASSAGRPDAGSRAEAEEDRRRHVWVEEDGLLRAVAVETGLSDYRSTEVMSGELDEGVALVVGVREDQ